MRSGRLTVLLVLAAMLAALASPAGAAPPPTKTVTIKNYAFHPGKLKIHKGTKVIWQFKDAPVLHNVTVTKGPFKFHSRNMRSGTYSHLFSRKGTWVLHCTLHPATMIETIVVS